jgi:hypothetical protein
MNRTLLLILCDFLLLTLLALTSWERAEPPRAIPPPAAAGGVDAARQDLVEVMQLSLEDEQRRREELAGTLDRTASTLDETRETLEARERTLAEREARLEESRRAAAEFAEQAEAARREAGVSRERLTQLQRDLEAREAEARRRAEEVAALEAAQTEARARIAALDTAVQVAAREREILQETVGVYRERVEVERRERERVQETAAQLAQGVGQLAESSAAITREIRDHRPINANILFNDYLANRVPTYFHLHRPTVSGPVERTGVARPVLVSDGVEIFALLHVDDTPFNLRESPPEWRRVQATLTRGSSQVDTTRLDFLSRDPRVVALPVSAYQAGLLGVKVYDLALDPFRFPEAVLISQGGQGYGEVPFRLDPANPAYVRMDTRMIRRLMGEFTPTRGDLVLSKSGELLGIMVTAELCVLVNNFLPMTSLPTGDLGDASTSTALREVVQRVRGLPGGR